MWNKEENYKNEKSQKSTMVYKKACDEMKEIKEAMQSVINEIGYWVFLFVLLFVPWILELICFIKHYPSHSILFDSNDVFVLITFPILMCFFAVRIIVLIKRKRQEDSESNEHK